MGLSASTQGSDWGAVVHGAEMSGCPVKHDTSAGCPVKHPPAESGCPVKHDTSGSRGSSAWLMKQNEEVKSINMMPAGNQLPAPDQRMPLSTHRAMSSIPKSDFNPAHQDPSARAWSYPSEQMFYNAMKRKGHSPSEEDMKAVVAIHNTVNERCWQHILEWESRHPLPDGAAPQLKSFEGRPTDLTPKASLLGMLGYEKPFDRHDWLIERDGKEVRYVIDFYEGKSEVGKVTSMHLDVRPALDSFEAFTDRVS